MFLFNNTKEKELKIFNNTNCHFRRPIFHVSNSQFCGYSLQSFFEKHLIKSVFQLPIWTNFVVFWGVKFAKFFTSQNWKKMHLAASTHVC
jgi:hypothetical protein